MSLQLGETVSGFKIQRPVQWVLEDLETQNPLLFKFKFKVDRLQIIVVAKKIYIYVSQLFISRMPKMRAIPHEI